ncbi:MAG: hypothetical protein O3C54_03770 [Proteobacteria bacterium]|nr:hypothetical protein [Pseudomonadota bacterium]
MKSGDKYAVVCLAFLLGSAIGKVRSKKKIIRLNKQPSIEQYLNRLTEFFDCNYLEYAEDEFLTLVDFGMSPENAFGSLVNGGFGQ